MMPAIALPKRQLSPTQVHYLWRLPHNCQREHSWSSQQHDPRQLLALVPRSVAMALTPGLHLC